MYTSDNVVKGLCFTLSMYLSGPRDCWKLCESQYEDYIYNYVLVRFAQGTICSTSFSQSHEVGFSVSIN